jgi:acetyltransferase-like isoleucine patch superfamily enzyme
MYFGPGHWRSGYSDRREQGGGFRFIGPDVTIADGSEQMELETFYMGSFAAIVNSWRKSRQLTVSRNTRMGRGALIMATGSVPDIIVDARMAVTGDNIGNGGAVQVGARGSTREASYPKEWRLRRQSTVAAED